MYRLSLTTVAGALAAVMAFSAPASAAVTITQISPSSYFYVGTLPTSGSAINESVAFTGLAAGSAYSLTLSGSGTGDFSNLAAAFGGTSSTTGSSFTVTPNNLGNTSGFSATALNGTIGANTTLYLTGLIGNAVTGGQGTGTYSGTLTVLAAAVPEASTWAMMTLGFGALGFALRRQRTSLTFA